MSYSPKINPILVRQLYQLKHSSAEKLPMTKMVDQAIKEYLVKRNFLNTHSETQTYNHNYSQ